MGETVSYSYLPTGELSQIQDAKGNITTLQYDSMGRLIRKTDPLGMTVTRAYDGNGNVVQETDANGNIKTYTYDAFNRMTQKVVPDNVYTMTYDVKGNLLQANNQQTNISFAYDDASRLVSTSTQGVGTVSNLPRAVISYTYDANNHRSTLSDPTGKTYYSYDNADRPVSITNPNNETYSFDFDSGNRLITLSRPGSVSRYSFDLANSLTSLNHSAAGSSIANFNYQRDSIGNLIQILSGQGTKYLGYDQVNQLVSQSNPEVTGALSAETFTYDSVYNRVSDQSGNYTYDSKSQRLIEDYNNQYFYDNNGNLIKRVSKTSLFDVTNYSYSSDNQLLGFQVYLPGNSSPIKEVRYAYDALGRRIFKQVIDHNAEADVTKTFSRAYVYDGQNILLEYNENNSLLASYTHSPLASDDVLSVDISDQGVNAGLAKTTGTFIYLKDGSGNITEIADTNGRLLQHYVYSAFGELVAIRDPQGNDISSSPSVNTSFTFSGREYDRESGNLYFRARYYDPRIGRFLQQDPSAGRVDAPVSTVNRYGYALNNPRSYNDPTGASIWGDLWGDFKGAVAGYGLGGTIGEIAGAALAQSGAVSQATIDKILVIEAIVAASFYTGGAAGAAAGGGTIGTIAGSIAGGLTGGLIGGIEHNTLGFNSFGSGFLFGFGLGAMAGGLGAGLAVKANNGFQLASSSLCKATYFGIGLSAAVVPGYWGLVEAETITGGLAGLALGLLSAPIYATIARESASQFCVDDMGSSQYLAGAF